VIAKPAAFKKYSSRRLTIVIILFREFQSLMKGIADGCGKNILNAVNNYQHLIKFFKLR
jgi:hypothetical protein